MQNYIIISKSYAEITPESAENGDFSDTGFITEYEQVTFSELCNLMLTFYQPSCSPNDYSTDTWYSTGFYYNDYRTDTDRNESLHFHHENTENAGKYWKWARIYADRKLNRKPA